MAKRLSSTARRGGGVHDQGKRQIPFYFLSRDTSELGLIHRRTLAQREPVSSLLFFWVLKGTVTQSDGPEDLSDECTVKMRSQAGLVVSPACARRQPSAPRVIGNQLGEPRDLKGDLVSSSGGLRDGDDGPHLLELCFDNTPPPELVYFD